MVSILCAFAAGISVTVILTALISMAMPILEFGGRLGTFYIWAPIIVRFFLYAFICFLGPASICFARFPRQPFQARVRISAAAIVVGIAMIVSGFVFGIFGYASLWWIIVPFSFVEAAAAAVAAWIYILTYNPLRKLFVAS